MFVRAVWQNRRLVDIKQGVRGAEPPTSRDPLAISRADFRLMTRGLFDR
jgi:hypothetical protein